MSRNIAIFENGMEWLKIEIPLFAKKIAPLYVVLNWKWLETFFPSAELIEQELTERLPKLRLRLEQWESEMINSFAIGIGGIHLGFRDNEGVCEFYLEFIFSKSVFQ